MPPAGLAGSRAERAADFGPRSCFLRSTIRALRSLHGAFGDQAWALSEYVSGLTCFDDEVIVVSCGVVVFVCVSHGLRHGRVIEEVWLVPMEFDPDIDDHLLDGAIETLLLNHAGRHGASRAHPGSEADA